MSSSNKWSIYRFAADEAERHGSPAPMPPLEANGLVDFGRLTSAERLAYLDGWDAAARGVPLSFAPEHLHACQVLGVRECRALNPKAAA